MRSKRSPTDRGESSGPSSTLPGATALGVAIPSWTELKSGDRIVIMCPPGFQEAACEVDIVSDDGALLWVYQEAGQGRILLQKSDQCLVWRKSISQHRPRKQAQATANAD